MNVSLPFTPSAFLTFSVGFPCKQLWSTSPFSPSFCSPVNNKGVFSSPAKSLFLMNSLPPFFIVLVDSVLPLFLSVPLIPPLVPPLYLIRPSTSHCLRKSAFPLFPFFPFRASFRAPIQYWRCFKHFSWGPTFSFLLVLGAIRHPFALPSLSPSPAGFGKGLRVLGITALLSHSQYCLASNPTCSGPPPSSRPLFSPLFP